MELSLPLQGAMAWGTGSRGAVTRPAARARVTCPGLFSVALAGLQEPEQVWAILGRPYGAANPVLQGDFRLRLRGCTNGDT